MMAVIKLCQTEEKHYINESSRNCELKNITWNTNLLNVYKIWDTKRELLKLKMVVKTLFTPKNREKKREN